MDYQKFKMATGCLIPCVLFVVAAAAVFVPMFTHETGYGLWTIGAPLLTGLCAAIVAVFLSRPLHHWMLTRELKNENSRVRLAAWQSDDPAVEFYASADGIWFNKKRYYWLHSLFLELEDLFVQPKSGQMFLIFKFRETHGRSAHYFDIEVPVPTGCEKKAKTLVGRILKEIKYGMDE